MNRENIQMVVGVIVIVLVSLFGNAPTSSDIEPQTATIVDSVSGDDIENGATPSGAQNNEAESSESVGQAPNDGALLPESFNEGELEEEFDSVQMGIDLLDSPMQ